MLDCRALDFGFGWFASPLHDGHYPQSMRDRVAHLPEFTPEQQAQLITSTDFLGINHYTTRYVRELEDANFAKDYHRKNAMVAEEVDPTWPVNSLQWPIVPEGLAGLLEWVHGRYGKWPLYITENGCSLSEPTLISSQQDHTRTRFLAKYIAAAAQFMQKHGSVLKGYFVWSFLDNLEWHEGFSPRFGLVRVDFDQPDKPRTKKGSFHWYQSLIQHNGYTQ